MEYIPYLDEQQKHLLKLNKKDIQISTMTILVKLENPISLLELDKKNTPEYFIKYNVEHALPKGRKTGNEFMNQYTLKYSDNKGRKNVKIFPNGKLHITGIKSFNEIQEISESVIDFSKKLNKVKDIEICLLNSNFHIGIGLNLYKLGEVIKNINDENLIIPLTFYDPNKYPGIKLRYHNTSLLIFSSGSIMVAGGKSLESVYLCVNFIKNILNDHYDYVSCKELTKFRKKK